MRIRGSSGLGTTRWGGGLLWRGPTASERHIATTASRAYSVCSTMAAHCRAAPAIPTTRRGTGSRRRRCTWATPTQFRSYPNTAIYGYDAIYELTQAVVNGSLAESYTCDAVGNRLSSPRPVSNNHNASNEPTTPSSLTGQAATLLCKSQSEVAYTNRQYTKRERHLNPPMGEPMKTTYDPPEFRSFVLQSVALIRFLMTAARAVARFAHSLSPRSPARAAAPSPLLTAMPITRCRLRLCKMP
jgi:hypothetical protein